MKLVQKSTHETEASALVATMIFILILALSIGGYMSYVSQQARLGSRSQAWNMSMTVSEAGVEEALEHLNTDGPTNLSANGWTSIGGGTYQMTRSISGASYAASYTVQINATNVNEPWILASAYVTPPAAASATPPFFFAAANVSTPGSGSVARGVSAVVYRPLYFQTALAARGNINMNGNGVTVDSYDSASGAYGGANVGDQGTVASDGGISNSVGIGNANIFGPLYYNPAEPTPTIGPNGVVGTHAWYNGGGSGFESGYLYNTANFTFPDTTAPYSSGLAPSSNTVVSITGTNVSGYTNINMANPPGSLTNGILAWVTTNNVVAQTTVYPGPEPNLQSNFTWTTTSTYPGPETGLITNTTVVSGGSSAPSSGDYEGSITTNTSATSSSTLPPSGTYLGKVTTNWSGNNDHGTIQGYTYNKISGYTYNEITGYTYQTWLYRYTTTTYSYAVYTSGYTYATNSYDNVLTGGNNYYATSLSSGTTYVTGGTATLVMPNGYDIGNLIIAPGAQLIVYVGGTSFSLAGNAVINQPGTPQSLIILCEPSVTSISLSGNAAITAVIVAPNANVQLQGGGNNNFDFQGSLMADNITLGGHWNFHYDVELSKVPISKRYILKSWQEFTPTQASN